MARTGISFWNLSRRLRGSLASDRISGWIELHLGPVPQESVVDSALLRSNFRPFKTAFLYTSCTQICWGEPHRSVESICSKNKAKSIHALLSVAFILQGPIESASACDDLLVGI